MKAPEAKQKIAFKEVLVVEQMQNMLRSTVAIVQFEDLRFQLKGENELSNEEKRKIVERMKEILSEEIPRTKSALRISSLDSRLGYESEMDYVYTPFVIEQKLGVLRDVEEKQIPAYLSGLEKED